MTDFSGKGSRRVFAARLLREAQSQALTSGSLVPQIAALAAGTLVATDRLPAVSTGGTGKTLTPANFRAYILPDGDKGDITTSASGATWTIDNGAVTLAKQADVATATVFYRKTAGTGAPEVQTLATLKTDLGLTGTNSGDQTITLTGDVTGSGTGSFAATVANDAVTYAKMQNVSAANRLLGRGSAGGAGDVEELTLGTGLSLSGTVLSATSSGTGDVVGPASATDNAVARFNLTTGKLIQNSSVTIADSGQVTITDSTFLQPQLFVRYDVGNYLEVTSTGTGTAFRSVTSAAGNGISFSTPGAGPNTISFSTGDIFGSAGTLVRFQTPTFRLIDASLGVNLDIGMNASGLVTYDITGGTPSHRFEDVVNINTTAGLQVLGTKVVGARGATISDPTGGTVQDSEARTAINTIIDRLQAHGLIA